MTTIKVSSDFIRPYSGRSSGDCAEWLAKVDLVAELQGITDTAKFIPLYLEGGALALYMQLSETERKDAKKIRDKLIEAFSDNCVVAFRKVMHTKWAGEQVDVYATELTRLMKLAGSSSIEAERIAKLAFINGMPGDVRTQLEQMDNIGGRPLKEVVDRARVLCGDRESGVASVAMRVASKDQPSRPDSTASGQSRNRPAGRQHPSEAATGNRSGGVVARGLRVRCYRCGGPHMVRFCTEGRALICFRCGGEGHFAAECDSSPGNGSGGTVASAVTPSTD